MASHHQIAASPYSRKSKRALIQCPGPECEDCRVRGIHSKAVKIVLGKKLCASCSKYQGN